jgi:hypothetical protein
VRLTLEERRTFGPSRPIRGHHLNGHATISQHVDAFTSAIREVYQGPRSDTPSPGHDEQIPRLLPRGEPLVDPSVVVRPGRVEDNAPQVLLARCDLGRVEHRAGLACGYPVLRAVQIRDRLPVGSGLVGLRDVDQIPERPFGRVRVTTALLVGTPERLPVRLLHLEQALGYEPLLLGRQRAELDRVLALDVEDAPRWGVSRNCRHDVRSLQVRAGR